MNNTATHTHIFDRGAFSCECTLCISWKWHCLNTSYKLIESTDCNLPIHFRGLNFGRGFIFFRTSPTMNHYCISQFRESSQSIHINHKNDRGATVEVVKIWTFLDVLEITQKLGSSNSKGLKLLYIPVYISICMDHAVCTCITKVKYTQKCIFCYITAYAHTQIASKRINVFMWQCNEYQMKKMMLTLRPSTDGDR